jgi:protein SCO1
MTGLASRTLISMTVMALACGASLFGKSYAGEGLLLAVDRSRQTATISHKEVPGHMPAMSMEYRAARPGILTGLEPGMRVRFHARVSGSEPVLESVKVLRAAPLTGGESIPQASALRLHEGDAVPPFQLLSQDGNPFRFSSLKGHLSLVQFIYTRCPVSDVCPRLSANFAYLQRKFGSEIELLSVTLDPKWDRPQTLTEYAQRWGADTHHWRFLTGTERDIRDLASRFGVVYWAEDGALTHTSAVAMISPDGRLIAQLEGSAYSVKQLADLVSVQLARWRPPIRSGGSVEHGS